MAAMTPEPLSAEEEAEYRQRGTLYTRDADRVWATLDRDRAEAAQAALDDRLEGMVAEMIGVESAIQEAMDRAQKVTRTLAALQDRGADR